MAKTTFSILKRQTYSIHKLACVVTFFSLVTGSVIRPLPVLAGEVVVRPGETLAEIAERYGTSVQRLMQLNNLLSPQDLWAGSRIQVPDRNGGGGARTTTVNPDDGGGSPSRTTKANASQPVKANETVSKLGGVSSEVHERCKGVVDYEGCVKVSTETPNTSNKTKFDTQDHFDINQDDSGVKKAFGSPCPQGTGMVTKKEGGFLGIGAKTVEVGCMTPYQYEMLNQMDKMNRPVVVPPVNNRKSCRSQIVGNQVFTNCW